MRKWGFGVKTSGKSVQKWGLFVRTGDPVRARIEASKSMEIKASKRVERTCKKKV
jgi:hypothetical protein